MDCRKVCQYILEGREGLMVRRHLRQCVECAAFQERLLRADALLRTTLPFEVPESLTHRCLGMVPQAAGELRMRASYEPRPADVPRPLSRSALYALLVLAIPLALSIGIYFWQQGWTAVAPWAERAWGLLPVIPEALRYWGGRLVSPLIPIRDALLFILSVLLMGLSLEQVVRSRRSSAEVRIRR